MKESKRQLFPSSSLTSSWPMGLVFTTVAPVLVAMLVWQLDPFDPVPISPQPWNQDPIFVPRSNGRMLQGIEPVGSGRFLGPEDVAYDPSSNSIYTGCADGWVKRVKLNGSEVEDWVNTGGRPLGISFGPAKQVIIADPYKGLLMVTENGQIELLTTEAEGVPFNLMNAVDVARDGRIYFTDASYKYKEDFILDLFEGRPHGRLLSYDPATKHTKVLLRDLYFPNGVVLSPEQDSVIFCETLMRWCRRYYIQGEKKGSVEMFISNLPGLPDNIHYDGEGHYWIALSSDTYLWNIAPRYPFIRKIMAFMWRRLGTRPLDRNSGVVSVDVEGKLIARYYDPKLSMISSGIKIGNHLYCGSLIYPHIIRLSLIDHAAVMLHDGEPLSPASATASCSKLIHSEIELSPII